MDRRTFLCETALVLVGAACRAWPACGAGAEPFGSADAAVFDPALAGGRALARHAARTGIEAWSADDIGMLWHAQLARRVTPRARLIAALRPSDQFVLTRLAASRGGVVLTFGPAAATTTGSGSRDSPDRT